MPVPMPPKSIDADPTSLPSSFHGYEPWATEELFRLAAWEYRLLARERPGLQKAMEGRPTRDEREQAPAKARRRAAEIDDETMPASVDAAAVIEAASALRLTVQAAFAKLEAGRPERGPVSESDPVATAATPLDLVRG
jgi:hypothetical protein